MTCEDCIHYEVCIFHLKNDEYLKCLLFQNKADFAEVVRCKDCAYWQDNNGGYPHEECRWGKDETPDADDYCSFGERKDGANR
jgi:hypothetical protein